MPAADYDAARMAAGSRGSGMTETTRRTWQTPTLQELPMAQTAGGIGTSAENSNSQGTDRRPAS